jgi:RNA polymerase sigma factor for flagellar operon FliA
MIDHLRKLDWRPRSVFRRVRELEAAQSRLDNATGTRTRSPAVADALGVSLDDFHHTLHDAAASRLVSLDQPISDDFESLRDSVPDSSAGPDAEMETHELHGAIEAAVATLPEREQTVVRLYYYDKTMLRTIGRRLNLSESRVCQIRGQAVRRLRAMMRRRLQPDVAFDDARSTCPA